ncbi:P-loop containing nucleoside triphosphate hydrolase protein [Cristinia sonorae]|uniref:RNA helicase n=1 Tax=Cristinia sonorae TaxID=1940300 RepID=A0A8K0UR68_9AGAR|nr:P-loop containing nucleoside triphosphate hydrolase protein [Cristinia sonorae]
MKICPHLKTSGVCHTPACPYRHDVKICVPCGVVCDPAGNYKAHIRGKAHKKKSNVGRRIFHCSLCLKSYPESNWDSHVSGMKHIGLARRKGVSSEVRPEEGVLPAHMRLCVVCDRVMPTASWAAHIGGTRHRKMETFVRYRAAFEEAEKDKNGVVITHGDDGVDFDVVEVADATNGVQTHVVIKNTVPQSRIEVREIRLGSAAERLPSPFTTSVQGTNMKLISGREFHIIVSFKHPNHGKYEDRLEIIFEDLAIRQQFAIVRPLRAVVGSKADYEQLRPRAPYVPRKRTNRDAETQVVPGVPPPATSTTKWVTKLPIANIPKGLAGALYSGDLTTEVATEVRRTRLPAHLDSTSYGRHFQELLWCEEFKMQHDLELYDMHDVTLAKHGIYYHLDVPGLAENRPSVLIGDRILVQRYGSEKGHWYEGHVHFVRQVSVGLVFHASFHGHTLTSKYNVRFKLNRNPLRRQHEALSSAFNPERILFPRASDILLNAPPPVDGFRHRLFNRLLADNTPQLQAVTSICHLPPGSVPFVVFGPPGTGKTVTIVEAILQLLARNPNARIIACAPSNSAADLIASRLRSLDPDRLFRLYAPSRGKDQVDTTLHDFAYLVDGHFAVPPLVVMKRFRVVVSTCVSASVLHGIGIPRGHFTHVFVDEAGQATEPEVMVSIKMLSDNATNVILSGDPKQLGPIIRSGVARELLFERSFIERLMEMQRYNPGTGHGRTVVKLIKNFRSHPDILSFPNSQFYRNELLPCADTRVTHSYINWQHLKNRKFPILFHAVAGEDQREASSPSFFNILELSLVKKYVELLKADRQVRITDNDIGIIAPYNAQNQRIRKTLKAVADEVKVGSVEEFQGQERRVIIISTVRSSKEFIEYDLRHTLGFVANPRRFNVAVTRAQALLIIVGDPNVLSLDPLWREFLNFIWRRGGWKGDEPTWDTDAGVRVGGGYDKEVVEEAVENMDTFARRIAGLTLADIMPTLHEDEVDGNEDRPWREME